MFITEYRGRLYYIETEPYLVFLNHNKKAITRKVLEINKENNTCYVRFNKKKILMDYFI